MSSFRKRILSATAVALSVGLLATGCSNLAPSTEAAADGTVVVVVPELSTQLSFDTSYAITASYFDTSLALNATLIRKPYVDSDQAGTTEQDLYNFEGVLAEDYTVSDDGLTYTFNLREGIMSEMGNELTSEDVVWSYQRKFGAATSIVPYVTAPAIVSADQFVATDKYTVTVTIEKPAYGFTLLSTMADITGDIYDSTYLKENATDADPWATEFTSGRYDFGFGAYTVESVDPGSEMVLVANENYALGTPEITRIIQRVVPDAGNRAQALKNGDADVALGLLAADLNELETDDSVLVPEKARNGYLVFSLNTKLAPFDDLAVRKAFTSAIDYDQIMSEVYQGRAEKKNTMLSTDAPGYDGTGLPDWEYDPDASKAALEAAGYTDNVPVTISVSNENQSISDLAVSIKSSALAAGFDVTVEALPATQMQEKAAGGQVEATIGNGEAISLTPSYQLQLLTTPGSSSNYAQWDSPTFQALVAAGDAIADPLSEEGGKAWNAAEKYWLTEEVPHIFLGQTGSDSAVASTLDGWTWRTDHAVDLSVMTQD